MSLHERLVATQSDAELERKARKARELRGKLWTQEELDWARRRADRLAAFFNQDSASRANGELPHAVSHATATQQKT